MKATTITLLAVGWLLLLACAAAPLTAAIQLAALGLGCLVTAAIAAQRVPARQPKLPAAMPPRAPVGPVR